MCWVTRPRVGPGFEHPACAGTAIGAGVRAWSSSDTGAQGARKDKRPASPWLPVQASTLPRPRSLVSAGPPSLPWADPLCEMTKWAVSLWSTCLPVSSRLLCDCCPFPPIFCSHSGSYVPLGLFIGI